MKGMAFVAGMLGISFFSFAPSGLAASIVDDINHSMKNIEQQICEAAPSPKCKPDKKKAVTHKRATKEKNSKASPETKTKASKGSSTPKAPPRDIPIPTPRPAGLGPPLLEQKIVGPTPATPIPKPVPKVPPPVVAAPIPPAVTPPPESTVKSATPEPPTPTEQAPDNSCLSNLAATGTSFAPVPQPGTSASCQIATPVRLFSVATKAGTVKLPDQPTVNCAFALTFSHFVDEKIQPLAQQSLGNAVVALGTGPGFDCRGRNGDSSAKISEHAIGNAVDIEMIRLSSKSQIFVKDALNTQSPNFEFLRDLRAAACSAFTTVLGPGTNSAHAEHFHVDLEVRRGGFRLCE